MRIAVAVLASVGAMATATIVAAADYPSKPITLIIGFAPGGPSDVMARTLTRKMEEILKQPLVIEPPGRHSVILASISWAAVRKNSGLTSLPRSRNGPSW
jgi:hypothetical protein